MDCFLSIEKKSHVLKSLKAKSKVKHQLPRKPERESVPINKLSYLPVDIHVRKWKVSQNNNIVAQEYLRINISFQIIQGSMVNNISKLMEINGSMKCNS